MKARYIIVIFIFIMLYLCLKQVYFYKRAKSAEKNGKLIEATDNYVLVVYMHIPFSPLEKRAIDRLIKISKIFHRKKELRKELYVYERLRSAIYGTRWIRTPHKEILGILEDKISTIKANMLIQDGYKKSFKDTKKELLHIMKTDLSPNPFLSLIGLLSFVLFILTTVFAILKCTERNRVDYIRIAKFFPIILSFWIVWITMMYLA